MTSDAWLRTKACCAALEPPVRRRSNIVISRAYSAPYVARNAYVPRFDVQRSCARCADQEEQVANC